MKNPASQEAALSTLGFLCDDLSSEHVTPTRAHKPNAQCNNQRLRESFLQSYQIISYETVLIVVFD